MKPLLPGALSFFPTQAIRPTGWLRRQLEIQAQGLSGNLDNVWPAVRDSRWIGMDREDWEHVPYWLDGFIPLAWLLDDHDMKRRATRYVDAILSRQRPDGWICPCGDGERAQYDVWATFLIAKVLVVFEDCTGDTRIESAVYRALKQLNRHLDRHTLFDWGHARWFECYVPLLWLYARRPEEWMLDLAYKLRIQGMDWRGLFADWRYTKPYPHGTWTYMTHAVNIAMALKAEAMLGQLSETPVNAAAKTALALLQRDHGMATGHFTGDECLNGTGPVQGSELCSIVEAMFSYEHLLAFSGDTYWGDMLERTVFNALPASISPDMWSHQNDQLTNQIECTPLPEDHIIFQTNSREAHVFGLQPYAGCCTANFGQGWPKFALSALMRAPDGIAVTAIAPVTVQTEIDGIAVTCAVQTEYPFRDAYTVEITTGVPVRFALYLRIPGFAGRATVDGQPAVPGESFRMEQAWQGKTSVTVALDMQAKLMPRPGGLCCAVRGPLLFALAPEEKWTPREYTRNNVERKYPYCDYEIVATSKWNYAFASDAFTVQWREVGDCPFSPDGAPVLLEAQMVEIPWEKAWGVCTPQPASRTPIGKPIPMRLIPYGCTNLRMTEMPLVKG